MTSDNTTRMKVLLAPAWDHNFPDGPARWLSHAKPPSTTIEDNYYPTEGEARTASSPNEFKEPWWPGETSIFDPAQRFCWDADSRAVGFADFTSGGPLNRYAFGDGSGRDGPNILTEIAETKNRLRGTGNPISSWNKSDTTYVDPTNFLESTNSNHYTAVGSYPNHFQDAIHDAIVQGSDPSDATTANKLIYPNKPGSTAAQEDGQPVYGGYQSTQGHQFSAHRSEGAASGIGPSGYWMGADAGTGSGYFEGQPETYTYGYEFTLNVESVTHTWSTLTTILPLPGPFRTSDRDVSQLVSLAIDMGAMREQITVKGKIYDGPNDPYAAPWEKTIRKQQLLDIVRSQWGAMTTPEISGHSSGKTMMQPNRFPALTIGPMHTLNPNGDQGRTFKEKPHANAEGSIKKTVGSGEYTNPQQHEFYLKSLDMWRYGEEPSDDVRGTPLLVNDPNAAYVFQVWDYKFGYSGRRRYRGLITRCSLNISGGSPDVWDFSFDFSVVKNETTYRRKGFMTEPPEQEEAP